jgi:hypothetical protein
MGRVWKDLRFIRQTKKVTINRDKSQVKIIMNANFPTLINGERKEESPRGPIISPNGTTPHNPNITLTPRRGRKIYLKLFMIRL